MRNAGLKYVVSVVVIVSGLLLVLYHMDYDNTPFGGEFGLINRILTARSDTERKRLIAELEKLPVEIYPFHHRWLLINDIQPWSCWSETGYDSSRSDVPRDIQLLAATSYGRADIVNGGFHQFFTNSTGVFAPEMVEWFDRAELHEAAAILSEAIAVFGDAYPRSQAARQEVLGRLTGESRAEWDPFCSLDDRFYATIPLDTEVFDTAADRWLRDTCGVTTLDQTPDVRPKQ